VIALPHGWSRIASVGSDIFASPDRRSQVRYRARVAPLQRFAAIADETLAELPEWRTTGAGRRERIVTHEGEYAFGLAYAGRWFDAEARRYVGVVYGDNSYDVLDAIALGGESIEPRARTMLHGASLRLGLRKRRYFYDRPADWHGHATGLTTHWFPPTFPARPTTIIIYPANPTNEQPQGVFDALIAHFESEGAELRELENPTPITARHGLEGVHWRLACVAPSSPSIARDLVILARGAFTYVLQLDSCHELDYDACAVFLAIARSVEPVPLGGPLGATEPGTVFSHYL
jgi:hypothetical protein